MLSLHMSRCPLPISAFFALHEYSTDFDVPWTREQDTTKNPNRRQTGAATVANDFKNFTVHTARLVCRAGKSIIHIQRQRYHMTTSGL